MTDDEAVEMMDDMKRMLSQDEIMDVYNFVDRNNISSPIYTYLDQYKGETGSYGLEENGGFDIEKTKQPVDLSQYDLEPLRQKFLRMHGEMPTDEDLRNIISVMKLEEAQDSEVVMIKEGQLGKAITKMLIEEMLKEEEVDDKTLLDNIDDLLDYDIHPITSILPSQYSDGDPEKVLTGLLNIIKKVNPNANIENKKISLQRAFDETMQELSKASWAKHTVTMGVKEYFRNNLQMFR